MKDYQLMVCTILVTALLLLGGLEFKLRSEHKVVLSEIEDFADLWCFQKSENIKLIYESVPNRCGRNARGQKGPLVEYARNDKKRIVVIGDSVADGYGVGVKESFSGQLRELLPATEIVTLAVSGYGTTQQLELLDEANKYNPDAIIWSYVLNDPGIPTAIETNGGIGYYFYEPRFRSLMYFNYLLRNTIAKSILSKCPTEYHQMLHCLHNNDIQKNFAEINEAIDVPVYFVIHPILEHHGFEHYRLLEVHQMVRVYAENEGFTVIDMYDRYKYYNVQDLVLKSSTYDWLHPNSLGHDIIAQRIQEEIQPLYE